ncbi:putative auxin-responsive protein IAA26-like [Capsicum annuum]|nr:putative auxin-responsive protein IAA26-like [Capsicum annuum]KAF3623459.1 putative auxin-responsive protein IAA26-like [Capsicum annuum]
MRKQASRNMDITLRKGTSPLSSPKPSAVPDPSLSGSRETNENEKPQKQKPMTKNFMSPTISASSKASIRKKILAERNEISSSCNSLPPHKASNLGSKTSPLNSISRRSSESENDQENTSVVDSYYRPYDPLTNDLGPRPKYLRYKPNRHRGTFLNLQDDNEGSLQQARDPSKLPEEHNLELENDEGVADSVEDDDEEMEEDVDGEWRLKGLFKILLLLVVFFMSCSNLSSTNSVVSSGSGDMIRKNIFEAVFHEIYGSESAYVDHLEDSQSSYELNNAVYEYIEDIVESLQVGSAEMEKTTEPQEGQSADKDIDQNSMEVEVAQNDVVRGDEEDETMITAAGEVTNSNEIDVEEVEGLDEQLQRDESLEKKNPEQENFAVLLDDISSSNYDDKVEQVEKISHERTGEVETSETASGGAEEIETEVEISNLDTELVAEKGPGNAAIIIGVSAASVLLVVTILFTRKPKASIEAPQAEVPNNTVIASVEGELSERKTETSVKVSALPEPLDDPSENHRNSHPERTPAIGSITQASSLCGPKQEASKEISYISAPKIELLGEIMVGEVSSSLRSCVRKNIKTEAAEGNTNLSRSVLLPSAVEEHSIADSPSHGSFTAEKKILKKKVEKDGEEVKKVVLTTPVRRSSRIRDRVGMSP